MNQSARRNRYPLKILQTNVGRGTTAHEIALQTAYESKYDILLVQEPYIFRDLSRRISKKHPAFECFTPTDDWTQARPRVLTYVRKGAGIVAEQVRPPDMNLVGDSDILYLSITSGNGSSFHILNIYNAPPGSINSGAAVKSLMSIPRASFSTHLFIAGDFNLHHVRWQPSYDGTDTSAANPLVEWIDSMDLVLISEADILTHNAGNVLDLAFASGHLAARGATAATDQETANTSDHSPLVSSLPWTPPTSSTMQRIRLDTLDTKIFMDLLSGTVATIPCRSPTSTAELDSLASELSAALQNALTGAARRSLSQGGGQPWWNEECKEAASKYRRERREDPNSHSTRSAQQDLRRCTKRAQRTFWRKRIDGVTESKDVFKMAKWHKSAGTFRMPPLKDPQNPLAPLATTQEAKRLVLLKNVLSNTAEAGDIPMDTAGVPQAALPFPDITDEEIRAAVLNAANSAPGTDEVRTNVLRIAWPLIERLISILYRASVKYGHHPSIFRTASVILINKPNKVDRTSPRSYRPIALLSVLGKGLERLMARRLSWLAIKHGVLARQQFGALPLRSSVDLTTCLTHDVETALNTNLTASLLTLDVKGAFNDVLPGRLVHRLRSQGWPDCVVKWAGSFSTNRKVCIRLDGAAGPPQDIFCGLPQGSPVSPILFMLYIAPLFHLGRKTRRFGYADDVALLSLSPSLADNSTALAKDLTEALDWGASQGITFDQGKSELIHFSRRKQDRINRPSVRTERFTISENANAASIRWLGVQFDRKLTFKWHVKTLTAKAMKVAGALRSLCNTVRGVPPHLMRRAVTACVLPVAYFAAETWWPGRTRPGARGPISNRVDSALNGLNSLNLTCARAILPVYKTTPTAVLYRESGLRPPEIALNDATMRAAARTRRLDPSHPLRTRADKVTARGHASSRFARHILALPASERVNPLAVAPWDLLEPREAAYRRIHAPCGRSKTQAATDFQDLLKGLPSTEFLVYSDGSKDQQTGATGAGFVSYIVGNRVHRECISLGTSAEVFDAEAIAALAGLKAALASRLSRLTENVWIFLDNLEVATQLLSRSKGSSQSVFDEFQQLAATWPNRQRLTHVQPGEVKICWVPGHENVPGNEAADEAAKEGSRMPRPTARVHTLASLKRLIRSEAPARTTSLWTTVAPESYKTLGISTAPRNPKELQLSRPTLGRLLAARTGHGDFADYHERFNHEDAHLLCRCGARKGPLHWFFCSIAKRRTPRPSGPPLGTIAETLGTWNGAQAFESWLKTTRFYVDICPRVP